MDSAERQARRDGGDMSATTFTCEKWGALARSTSRLRADLYAEAVEMLEADAGLSLLSHVAQHRRWACSPSAHRWERSHHYDAAGRPRWMCYPRRGRTARSDQPMDRGACLCQHGGRRAGGGADETAGAHCEGT